MRTTQVTLTQRASQSFLLRWISLFALLLCASVASADSALSDKMIEQWLKSQPELQKWAVENKPKLAPYESKEEWKDLESVDNMLHSLKASGLYGDVSKITAKYGFDSPEEWAGVTIRVLKAFGSLQMEAQNVTPEGMQKKFEELSNNPQIPAEQKAAIKQMMDRNIAMMKVMSTTTAADKAIVKKHLQEIESQMQRGDQEKGAQ